MSKFSKVKPGDVIEMQLEGRARYASSYIVGNRTTKRVVVTNENPDGFVVRSEKKNRHRTHDWFSWTGTSLLGQNRDYDVESWDKVGTVEPRRSSATGRMRYNPDLDVMRDVVIRPYIPGLPIFRLQLIDTGQVGYYGKSGIGYRLAEYSDDGKLVQVIFDHEGHGIIWHPGVIDDDEAVGQVLSWLTLKPGDTDEEFFADYTDDQLFFAEEHGESLELDAEAYQGFEGPEDWPGDDAYEALGRHVELSL